MYLKEPKNIQLRTFLFHSHFQPSPLQGTIATFLLILIESWIHIQALFNIYV